MPLVDLIAGGLVLCVVVLVARLFLGEGDD
jgi:hypothetical protein